MHGLYYCNRFIVIRYIIVNVTIISIRFYEKERYYRSQEFKNQSLYVINSDFLIAGDKLYKYNTKTKLFIVYSDFPNVKLDKVTLIQHVGSTDKYVQFLSQYIKLNRNLVKVIAKFI